MDRETSLTNTWKTLCSKKQNLTDKKKADGYIQHLLELGISKLTETDETDIQRVQTKSNKTQLIGV